MQLDSEPGFWLNTGGLQLVPELRPGCGVDGEGRLNYTGLNPGRSSKRAASSIQLQLGLAAMIDKQING